MTATPDEYAEAMPGDEVVAHANVTMDRGFTVAAAPDQVWPWMVQLGKRRAGWYLPRAVERVLPPSRRAYRRVESRWQALQPGDVIPDYGGKHETFEVVSITPPEALIYRSRRGHTDVSWAIVLRETTAGGTRVRLRLRLGPVARPWLANTAGELVDLLTVAGMAAGLRERVAQATTLP